LLKPGAEVVLCIGSPPSLLLKSWSVDPTPFIKEVSPAPDSIVDWYAGLHMANGGGKIYMGKSLSAMLLRPSARFAFSPARARRYRLFLKRVFDPWRCAVATSS
jgi:hypothetical protein